MKKIKLEILGTMLHLWEDANIFGEFSFQNYLKIGKELGELKTQPGSEMSENGVYLYRSITNWKKLRILLEENDEPINHYAFLPRVPKLLRGDIGDNRELFSELIEMGGVLLFPIFVSKWIRGKKVFSISEEAVIPLVPLSEENYLPYLPYDNFIINMEKPFIANFAGSASVFTIKTFMVSKREDIVHILIIPEEMCDFLYTEEERKILERLTFLSGVKNMHSFTREKKKAVRMFLKDGSENIDMLGKYIPGSIMYSRNFRVYIPTGEYNYRNQDRPEKNLTFIGDVENGQTDPGFAVTSYVNGLCKIMSEFHNAKGVHISTGDGPYFGPRENNDFTPEVHVDFEGNKLSWDEVTEGQVMHLISEKKDGKVSFTVSRSSEKCFHLRRTHSRHYVQPDNSVKTILVKGGPIRLDKFQRDGHQSGSTNLKG